VAMRKKVPLAPMAMRSAKGMRRSQRNMPAHSGKVRIAPPEVPRNGLVSPPNDALELFLLAWR
jgi:hypothetical protein